MVFFPFLFGGIAFLVEAAAALIPAVYLMFYIYKKDTVEKEPRHLLWRLVILGVLAGLASIVLENIFSQILDASMISPDSPTYSMLMAFLVVAAVEEGTKYLFMYKRTWNDPNFNYQFDGIVYAVFTSLGFAGFENLLYVQQFGLSVAIPRALLSIPGHMSFAVVMGIYYGRARRAELYGNHDTARSFKWLAYVMAVLLHGFYDACLMIESTISSVLFVIFVIALYVWIFKRIGRESATDTPFEAGGF